MTRLLKMGALAGAAGGLALALFLRLVGEGAIGQAVALENERAGGTATEELFSRGAQQLGGMAGAVLYGVCLGAILAVVLAAVRHRMAGADDWRRSLAVAGAGFVTVSLVPFCKYPANPPAVGDPSTVGRRTALYLVMLAWSVVGTWAAWRLSGWLRDRHAGDHLRLPAAAAVVVVIASLGFVLLPGSPDPVSAPATLVWRFRLAALGGSALFWSVTGCVLGWLMVRRPRAVTQVPVGSAAGG